MDEVRVLAGVLAVAAKPDLARLCIDAVDANYGAERVTVAYDPGSVAAADIEHAITKAGYRIRERPQPGSAETEDAEAVAGQLIDALVRPFQVEGHEIFIGASIGISLFPEDGTTSEALIRNADTAMYRAKALKRNTWQRYTAAMGEQSRERFDLEVGLRRALERGELQLYFQPQAFIDGGRICGAEALIRWVSPEGETIMPERFIPLAEESGLSHALGRWVLREACRHARQWELNGLDLQVAVNLSGAQVVHGDVVGDVCRALQESGLAPERLELEITEGFLISHADEGVGVLHELRELGVMLAVDDFGTGYSSLARLEQLPIDTLKIDQLFLRRFDESHRREMLRSIIGLAHALDLTACAEGVEDRSTWQALAGLGCDTVQGFAISRPMPPDQVDSWLAAHDERPA